MGFFCKISNALALFPIFLCFHGRLYTAAICMTFSMLCSIYYHMDETNENALFADMIGCSMVVSAGAYLTMNAEYIFTYINAIALVYCILAIYCFLCCGADFNTDHYDLVHTGWHVFSFYALSTFFYSYIENNKDIRTSSLSRPIIPDLCKSKWYFHGAKVRLCSYFYLDSNRTPPNTTSSPALSTPQIDV